MQFPTFFNEKTNAVKFGLAYVYRNKAVLTDVDLTRDLLAGENASWGIVSPGLIPAGKKPTVCIITPPICCTAIMNRQAAAFIITGSR